MDFNTVSHGIATFAFGLLTIHILTRYMRRRSDRTLFVAVALSAFWSMLLTTQPIWGQPAFMVRYLSELARDGAWLYTLYALLRDAGPDHQDSRRWTRLAGYLAGALLAVLAGLTLLHAFSPLRPLGANWQMMIHVVLLVLGLSMVEQIWRNAPLYGRSSIRYLCVGIGGFFAYDFFIYSDALLFQRISPPLWDARGAVNALLAPLLAVSMINTRKQPVQLQLSRGLVFHAGTLILAGGYLLLMAAGGYYIRALGGTWGEALQVVFLAALLILMLLLMTSTRFRARLMMFISQNFFDYKYDYREEWLKITEAFSNLTEQPPLQQRVIRVLADLVESHSGALWVRDDEGHFILTAKVNMVAPKHTQIDRDADIVNFFGEKEWVLDLDEYHSDPVRYELLEIPDAILGCENHRLVIPLFLGRDLYGIAVIGQPFARVELNWENFDLIRVVARQVCNFLAQAETQDRLSRAMQFEAVNKASAFMVHDLKTVIAQLSLLVNNASRHRDNPAFIDDMIRTTENAVRRMSRLVDHIRRPEQDDHQEVVDLVPLVRSLVEQHASQQPAPVASYPSEPVQVQANQTRLRSVLGHLIQNAQDATDRDGEVLLTFKKSADHVVLFIQDSGAGMSEEFIRTRLFQPFESTKGLTGMGIGAYQAREYIRSIGGNIDVTSEVGVGSCFSLRLPISEAAAANEPETDSPGIAKPPARTQNS